MVVNFEYFSISHWVKKDDAGKTKFCNGILRVCVWSQIQGSSIQYSRRRTLSVIANSYAHSHKTEFSLPFLLTLFLFPKHGDLTFNPICKCIRRQALHLKITPSSTNCFPFFQYAWKYVHGRNSEHVNYVHTRKSGIIMLCNISLKRTLKKLAGYKK